MYCSLSEYLEGSHNNRLEKFFSVCIPLCRFIGKSHKNELILKGLNPDNILIDFDNNKIKYKEHPGSINDMLPYISPEQTGRLNKQVDLRSGLYSLGVVFYEMLTGDRPFKAKDMVGWYYAHMSTVPVPPCSVSKEIPAVLSDIVMRLLAKSPDDRYQSISGLTVDLEKCRQQWYNNKTIEPFSLGQADIRRRLQSDGCLIGREKEASILLEIFNQVHNGEIQTVFISGYPGIGKTSLVNEFKQTVAGVRGQFVRGIYKQYRNNIPYSGILQAAGNLIRHIFTLNRDETETWRKRIIRALGLKTGIISQFIPELKQLIGEQHPVQIMSPKESENAFFEACKNFLQLFIYGNYPLVVFLDDLQWLDLASVKLLSVLITGAAEGRLLFIGAYRSNETDKNHPVYELIRTLKDAQIPVTQIPLESLDYANTHKFVSEILQTEGNNINELVKSIFIKSAGNPLYIKQIVQDIHDDGYLEYSTDVMGWVYRDSVFDNIHVKENVIEYVMNRIKKLPGETIELLEYSACIGRDFNLDILAEALNLPVDVIKQKFQPAIEMGIVLEKTELNIVNNSPDLHDGSYSEENILVTYEFFHDRVREAAYSLISHPRKKEIHLKLGRVILERVDLKNPGDDIFDALDHMNYSMDLISGKEERIKLAEYNFLAARKARYAIALASSQRYLEAGMELLPEDCWQEHYRLSFDIYLEYYWCLFSNKGFSMPNPYSVCLLTGHPPSWIKWRHIP